MKKLAIGVIVSILCFVGWNYFQGCSLPESQPVVVTTSPTTTVSVFDRIDANLQTINDQVLSLKTNDAVMRSMLEQIQAQLNKMQSELNALK